MKKLSILFFLIPLLGIAQVENYKKEAKKDLTGLKNEFEKAHLDFENGKDSLKVLSEKLSPKLKDYYNQVVNLKKKSDSIYEASKVVWSFYAQKGVNKQALDSIFAIPTEYELGIDGDEETIKVKENQIYLLFNNEDIVLKEKIVKDTTISKILGNVLTADSEAHLGDFWFPQNNQKIIITKLVKCDSDFLGIRKLKTCDTIKKTLRFVKIEIQLYEGSLTDIKVYLKDENGNTHLFENRRSISLLHYTTTAPRFYLENKSQQTPFDVKYDYSKFKLRLSDVLRYFSKPGRNFIPDDQSFAFPIITKEGKTNKDAPNVYELRQSTTLENVLDLRAYTDFLGLFGETPNGIAQFEGQADFFVNPFRFSGTSIFLFKKIKPYIVYSRLDENDRVLNLTPVDSITNSSTLANRLDNLQKSDLDVGVKLDFISFTLGKEYPFEAGFYTSARYQRGKIETDSLSTFDYKTLGLGGGLNLEFRRYDNFDFRYSLELSNYDQDSYNNIEGISDAENFWVLRNEAEISYYPSNAKKNAIFVRLKVFDDFDDKEGSNFFQFQFGYRFTVGVKSVKGANSE